MTSEERIGLRLDADLKRAASKRAKAEDLTLSQVIRRLLREWLGDAPLEQEDTLTTSTRLGRSGRMTPKSRRTH